jgi:hypothetical protein
MVGSDREVTPLSITSFINPTGSRNLEDDPLQDVLKGSRVESPGAKH